MPSEPSAAAPITWERRARRLRSRQETWTTVATPCSRARATAASGDMRGLPAWLSVSPTRSTWRERTAMRSRTWLASGVAGSEISAEVRASSGMPEG